MFLGYGEVFCSFNKSCLSSNNPFAVIVISKILCTHLQCCDKHSAKLYNSGLTYTIHCFTSITVENDSQLESNHFRRGNLFVFNWSVRSFCAMSLNGAIPTNAEDRFKSSDDVNKSKISRHSNDYRIDFSVVLKEIGNLGRYQIFLVLLAYWVTIPAGFNQVASVFLAAIPDYR